MRTLYRGGAVYSLTDPFATALITEGDTVAWLGSDAAATAHADAADAIVELEGALVTPAFGGAPVHVTETGPALGGGDLRSARSVSGIRTGGGAAARANRGRPVLGHGW